MSDGIICKSGMLSKFPKIIIPELKYHIYPNCFNDSSQTDNYRKHYNIDIFNYMKLKNNNKINLTKEIFYKTYSNHVQLENTYSNDYYVLYNSTSFDWIFYYYIISLLTYISLNKDICTLPLMRFPNVHKDLFNGINSIDDVFKKLQSHINDNTIGFEGKSYNDATIKEKYLDHFSWAKDYLISVNLTLLSGIRGESTLMYFKKAKTNTLIGINKLDDLIDYRFKNSTKILRDVYKIKIRDLYSKFTNSIDKEKSIINQFFIKKDLIDKIAYLCIPTGYPIPYKLSDALDKIQKNKISDLEDDILKIKNFSPDMFKIEGLRTKELIDRWNLGIDTRNRNKLSNLQARLIPYDQIMFTTPGNIIIKSWTSSGLLQNDKINEIYKLIMEMCIELKDPFLKMDSNCIVS